MSAIDTYLQNIDNLSDFTNIFKCEVNELWGFIEFELRIAEGTTERLKRRFAISGGRESLFIALDGGERFFSLP